MKMQSTIFFLNEAAWKRMIELKRHSRAAMKGKKMITKWRKMERSVVLGSRYLTLMAVLGSLASSVLMFYLGLYDIYMAFEKGLSAPVKREAGASPGALAVIKVIEGLDRFLIAIVLLYFAYGVYSLFIRPEQALKEERNELALPSWLRVKEIGQLKQVVAEVIIVIIFVLFLRVALQVFQNSDMILSWQQIGTLLLLPFCTALLAIALKLVELHPKPRR
jgi:uncharacterized membrane protein YqhA